MNADQLLAHYDQVTDQKEAGSRLRNFIVDLAVRGKLVPQDQTDEPAWELLRRIARAKARLVKAGNIRRQRSDESSRPGGLSYGLPPGWAAADFADVIVELRTGPFGSSLHQADYAVGGTPVINPASMQDGKIIPVKKMAVAKDTLDRLARFKLEVGDIVMARRGEMGRCAVVTEQENGWLCGTGSLIIRVHEYINPWYLAMLMGSPLVRDYLNGSAVGATMMNLNQSILFTMRIGVPPLAEQYRIVAKIDELMGLCDRLEGARAERECVRDRFAIASLVRLRAPERDLSVFRAHAAFAIDNVDRLTTRADQIQGLRLAVLNLAVCGKLVLRDPNDEPAWVLLRCIAEEKKRLRGAGEIRNRGLLPARSPETVPFALPAGWTWTQIAEIGVLSPRNKAPDDAQASFVPMSMIRSGYGASHHHEIRRWGTIKFLSGNPGFGGTSKQETLRGMYRACGDQGSGRDKRGFDTPGMHFHSQVAA